MARPPRSSTNKQVRTRQAAGVQTKVANSQIADRNFLQPQGFRFSVSRAPKISYFGNAVNIPAITLGVAEQPNYLRDIPIPGDKMLFEDLTMRFLVDENLENYMEIQNWMRGLGYPESLEQIYDLQDETIGVPRPDLQVGMNIYSDGTLMVYDALNNAIFKVKFSDLFPISLSTLQFDATVTDTEYFTAEVVFKYTMYNITDIGCCS